MAKLKSGYIYVWDANRKRNNYLHRMIVEKDIGRYLFEWETIHHIDGNKENNSLDNLMIIGSSEHAKLEWEQRKKKWKWSRNYDECIDCGTTKKSHHAKGRCKNCDMRFRRRCS